VAGCLEGDCHFKTGNTRASHRVIQVQKILEDLGWEPDRVAMINMSAGMGEHFAQTALEFTEKIRNMGPSPAKQRKPEPQAVS
jgi:coenzyme F420-reducing hydrogenase delta subunit